MLEACVRTSSEQACVRMHVVSTRMAQAYRRIDETRTYSSPFSTPVGLKLNKHVFTHPKPLYFHLYPSHNKTQAFISLKMNQNYRSKLKLKMRKSFKNLSIQAMHCLIDVPPAYRVVDETRSALQHQSSGVGSLWSHGFQKGFWREFLRKRGISVLESYERSVEMRERWWIFVERVGLEELERNEEMKEKMNSCKKKKWLLTVEKMKKQERHPMAKLRVVQATLLNYVQFSHMKKIQNLRIYKKKLPKSLGNHKDIPNGSQKNKETRKIPNCIKNYKNAPQWVEEVGNYTNTLKGPKMMSSLPSELMNFQKTPSEQRKNKICIKTLKKSIKP